MRRWLALSLIVVLVVLAVVLAGCGSSPSGEGTQRPTEGPVGAADEAACAANRRTIASCVQQYYGLEGKYPTSIQQLVPKYLDSVPVCPAGGTYSLSGTTVYCSVHGS
jgi:predicted small secreted protein